MNGEFTRRGFLRTAGILGSAAALPLCRMRAALAMDTPAPAFPHANQLGWQLSASQYTFRRFALYDALPMIASLGVRYVEPAFFLKLDKDRPNLKVNESLSAADRKRGSPTTGSAWTVTTRA